MNALIKKEIRLLLPAWIAAMLLVCVVLPFLQFLSLNNVPYNPDFLPIPFGLGILFLSLASFGQEFSFKTFSLSLSQPVPRSRIWLVKITTLVAAFASVLLALFICCKIYFYLRPIYSIPFPIGILIVCGCVIFSGGLWTTLLLRQTTGASWFTLLAPYAILIPVGELSDHHHWPVEIGFSVFIAYSIAGFFFARHLFLNAQDRQWTGGEISFPWRRKISERTAISSQPRHWFSALVRKEFQLHQANLLIAVIIFVLHVASVAIRKIHTNFENLYFKAFLELIWALWLLMPLLIGSAAVAEERRLGIIESQLCLPVSRRAQLCIKFSVALVLSLILGGVMPFIIERTHDFNYWIFVVAAAVFFISFYASTLARATLQAIGLAIGVAVAIYFYEAASAIAIVRFGHGYTTEQFGTQILKIYLGLPILLLVLSGIMFWNFKWLHENWKLWRRNFIVVLAAFATIFILSKAIYFRAWEFLTPADKPHGLARLSESEPPKLLNSLDAVSVLLSGGKLWSERTIFSGFERIVPYSDTQHFIDGSNWSDAASDDLRILAIKSDGSLWSFQTYGGWRGMPLYPLTQIGSQKDWLHVAGGGDGFLLLKKDRTLWTWGKNGRNLDSGKLKKYVTLPPQLLDEGTNWADVFSYGGNSGPFARKNDGSIWVRRWETNSTFYLHQLESWQLPNEGFISLGPMSGGIKTNGELWLIIDLQNQKERKIQLGQNEKWKAVAGTLGNSLVALRSDGTLWKWPDLWNLIQNPNSAKAVQLGNHSDWIALSSRQYDSGAFALAADGSLWIWDEPSKYRWLAPSHKPVFIGNIFEAAK